jgi:hypothetical protein
LVTFGILSTLSFVPLAYTQNAEPPEPDQANRLRRGDDDRGKNKMDLKGRAANLIRPNIDTMIQEVKLSPELLLLQKTRVDRRDFKTPTTNLLVELFNDDVTRMKVLDEISKLESYYVDTSFVLGWTKLDEGSKLSFLIDFEKSLRSLFNHDEYAVLSGKRLEAEDRRFGVENPKIRALQPEPHDAPNPLLEALGH